MLKAKTFCASHHKTTSKHPGIQKFQLYFAKDFCDPKQKREKHPAGSSCAWAGLWPAIKRTLRTSQIFYTFFKHNVGNFAASSMQTLYRVAKNIGRVQVYS